MQRPAIDNQAAAHETSRRRFLRLSFFGLLGVSSIGALAALVEFLRPRGRSRIEFVGHVRDFPLGGDPVQFLRDDAGVGLPPAIGGASRGFSVVNLDPADTRINGSGGSEGIVALADYCTHLGCRVPWREQFTFNYTQGWFRCPCHGVTYTRAGARVFGPSARGLDAHPVEIRDDGSVYVHREQIIRASEHGPAHGTPIPPRFR